MTTVRIMHPGLLTTVQDRGRRGFEQWGIPVGGVLDDYAFHWANWLLDQDPNSAVIELTAIGPSLEVLEAGELSLTGADFNVRIDGVQWRPGEARRVESGQVIRFGARRRGLRAYLGFPGGVVADSILDSVSTDVVAGIGGMNGRPLRRGDVVTSRKPSARARSTRTPTAYFTHRARVVRGVGADQFSPTAFWRLLNGVFYVGAESNGIGLRLGGEIVDRPSGILPSEGLPIGSIECPPSGELLVLMKGRGSIGGYPALAHIIEADWPRLAQWSPGMEVRFDEVTIDEARAIRKRQEEGLGKDRGRRITDIGCPVTSVLSKRDEWGRLLPGEGEWVVKDERIGELQVMGQTIPVRAAHDGTLHHLATWGELVRQGQVIFQIEGSDDNHAG